MNSFIGFINIITTNILRNPPILLGLIAALGLALQRKSFAEIVKGTFLTAFGMFILSAGVDLLAGTIVPINSAFQNLAGAAAGEGLNDATFTASYGGQVGLAMFFGLILHLLIARFTRFKVVFLTGHMIWWFPFIFIAAGVEGGLTGIPLVVFGSTCSAVYWSVMPWLLRKYVSDVTGDTSFTIGHPTGFLSLISGFVASKVGNKKKSTEDFKLSPKLSFFREISITGCIVIIIMFIIVGFIAPNSILSQEAAAVGTGQLAFEIVMNAITQGITFGAGLVVMLQGVRMLIAQIVPAFKGISEKLVPDAIPAFDCPILFNYKPNAVLIGFVVGMITSTILILICNATNLFGVVLVPLVITSFFECGAAAVIGEGQGGLKGSIIGTAAASFAMVAVLGISALAYSGTIQNWMLIFGGNDFSLLGTIAKFIASLFGGIF